MDWEKWVEWDPALVRFVPQPDAHRALTSGFRHSLRLTAPTVATSPPTPAALCPPPPPASATPFNKPYPGPPSHYLYRVLYLHFPFSSNFTALHPSADLCRKAMPSGGVSPAQTATGREG